MNDELIELDATAQAELVARGELTALELVDAAIARIEAVEPRVHALASTAFDFARQRAKGPLRGPFAGVPFLLKDLLSYPGQSLCLGSRLFRGNVAQAGSPYTERLDQAGLIVLGKTTTSEFGMLGSTETRLSGTTYNPWDLTRSATGSSGGSAAAVASGMVPMAHASDGGGSVRIPASACGLFGLKPSRGRCVPQGQSFPYDMLSEHCVSRSVRDSARMLAITEDRAGALPPVGYVERPLTRRLRIGFYVNTLFDAPPESDVLDALHGTAKLCRELGHEVVEAQRPAMDAERLSSGFFTFAGAAMHQMASMMQGLLGRAPGEADLEPYTLALIDFFRGQPTGALERALADFDRAGEAMRAFLAAFDVVLCPTMPMVAPPLGTLSPELPRERLFREMERISGYTCIHSIAGVPAMSVPLSWTPAGLPVGSHFAAPLGQEGTLLELAYQLEAAAPWAHRRPPVWAGAARS